MSKHDDIRRLFADDGREVDVLVNSAGAMGVTAFEELTSNGNHNHKPA